MSDARTKTAYDTFRNGFRKDAACPVPRWEDAPDWVRDVARVAYLQGKLDGPAQFERVSIERLAHWFGVSEMKAREAQGGIGFMYRQFASEPHDASSAQQKE